MPVRARPADQTIAALLGSRDKIGVTRLADQTGLDRIGLPCFAAIRPNSRTLSAHHGKGLSVDQAKVSALVEAAEFAVTETVPSCGLSLPVTATEALGHVPFRHRLPANAGIPEEISWLEATSVLTGRTRLVARDLLFLGTRPMDLAGISRSSGGTGAGCTVREAVFQGLCELVERDAITLASVQPVQRRIDPRAVVAREAVDLTERLEAASMRLSLFDLTTEIGLPVIKAVIEDQQDDERRLFSRSAGFGTHPQACQAVVAAISEACQTRISNISGARDDFSPTEYDERHGPTRPVREKFVDLPPDMSGVPPDCSFATALEVLSIRLSALHLGGPSYYAFDTAGLPISVTKVFCDGLEDRVGNRHWQPGPRSLSLLVAQ